MIGGLTQDERNRATAEQGEMAAVHLEGASLKRTRLEKAVLYKAHLERANLFRVHLLGANVVEACLQQANLRQAHIQGSFLEGCILSDEGRVGPWILNVNWERTDLAIINWSQVNMLADEYEARQKGHDHPWQDGDIYVGGRDTRIGLYERAVRANRQLAVALQTQGLNELAARFAYRAQKCQRIVLRLQRKYIQYLFSLLLDLLLRPDIVLEVPSGPNAGLHVLDAKFKLQIAGQLELIEDVAESETLTEVRQGVFKPEDLYKMHTYLDAIPQVKSAWILYPGSELRFFGREEHTIISTAQRLPQSVRGVGTIPLKPAREEHRKVRDVLSSLLGLLVI
jgi:hypothetical protein